MILGYKNLERVVRQFPHLVSITNDSPKRILRVVRARKGRNPPSMLPEVVNEKVNKKRKRVPINTA